MSRKRTKAKPRTTYVTLDMGEPVTANGFWLDPKSGECGLLNDDFKLKPQKSYVDLGYSRAKGHKSLNKAQLSAEKLYINPNRALEGFDFIYAVDTNCKAINLSTISVTSVVGGTKVKTSIPGHTAIIFRPLKCIELLNPGEKFENLGWKTVIDMIQNAPRYSEKTKTVLIVDSDLGNIESYNNFSKPIYGSFYLPKNFQLIYASSDAGKENIANKMISLADSSANMIFDILVSNQNVHEYEIVENQPYSHIRIWEPAHNNSVNQ